MVAADIADNISGIIFYFESVNFFSWFVKEGSGLQFFVCMVLLQVRLGWLAMLWHGRFRALAEAKNTIPVPFLFSIYFKNRGVEIKRTLLPLIFSSFQSLVLDRLFVEEHQCKDYPNYRDIDNYTTRGTRVSGAPGSKPISCTNNKQNSPLQKHSPGTPTPQQGGSSPGKSYPVTFKSYSPII